MQLKRQLGRNSRRRAQAAHAKRTRFHVAADEIPIRGEFRLGSAFLAGQGVSVDLRFF